MNKNTKILVTGGAGYIGSHCILKLFESGYNNIISIDNFCNSTKASLQKIEDYTSKKIHNEDIDLKDSKATKEFFTSHPDISTIIHFAAFKDPFESINYPVVYYENNVGGLINLIKYSEITAVDKIIFSSTCAIYGNPISIPVDESHSIKPQNPYANSKWMCENILRDIATERRLKVISLRYFNPIGSNSTSGLKEFYNDNSMNIIPQIVKVINGDLEAFPIYGGNLQTKDGTGIRDFIHVDDLAEAHVKAMEFLEEKTSFPFYDVYNVGTGVGHSVLEIIREFEKKRKIKIPTEVLESRPKEVAEIYADVTKIRNAMSWHTSYGLGKMIESVIKSFNL